MRVLVVDDDAEFREELNELLRAAGHAAEGVASAVQATASLAHREFDVMFTDLKMGRQSGIELLRAARATYPRMLVVMLTANATVESAIHALQLGAFDYLRKPVSAAQVDRVLALVGQQLALTRAGATPLDPARYASALAADGGYEVLLIAPPPIRVTAEKVRVLPLDPDNPSRIRADVDEFVLPRDRAAVVLAAVEQLLARHREEEIAALLEGIRASLQGKGPLAVGYDPDKITASGALAVRASIVSADAHSTLETLASPIRRLVLRRMAEGSCSFSQAMASARLDDTSLIAFHLRKLSESGLVAHVARERYRLTPRGRGAVRILQSIDELDSVRGSGNRIFPSKQPNPPRDPAPMADTPGRSRRSARSRRDRPRRSRSP
jgi:CheY-like chemotaxis protein/DNA-binding HxlR family transcriptional regulator